MQMDKNMESQTATVDIESPKMDVDQKSSPNNPAGGLSQEESEKTNVENNPHHFQRDEQFHVSLKRAASLRRQLSKDNGLGHSQEASIARALNAAATEFCMLNAAPFDDAFFYSTIELAMKGSKLCLNVTNGQQESHLELSDDLSLSEMIGVIVNRSTTTITQQQKEIYCLRLVVRELMQELLDSDGGGESSLFISPTKETPPGEEFRQQLPMMTPSTANTTTTTTIASPESEAATPLNSSLPGLPYSSRAANRHVMSQYYRVNRSFSSDGHDSPTTPKLKEVQKSLDETMRGTEQQQRSPTVLADDSGSAMLLEWQARHQRSPHSPTARKDECIAFRSFLTAPKSEGLNGMQLSANTVESPSLGYTRHQQQDIRAASAIHNRNIGNPDSLEKTHEGHIVESIIDAIIEKSLEMASVESTMEGLMFPGLLPGSEDEHNENSHVMSGRISFNESTQGQEHEPQGPVAKDCELHEEPPAHLMRMESRNIDANESYQVRLLTSVPDSAPKRGPVNDSNESDTYIPHIFEDRDDDDYVDEGVTCLGDRRMVVLVSRAPIDPTQAADQETSLLILHSNGIDAEFVDGADPNAAEIRDSLFGVSGLPEVYPQFFMVDDDGMTEFFGDFQEVERLNDTGELRSTILGRNFITTYQLQGAACQEEKKDEQSTGATTASRTLTFHSNSWTETGRMDGTQPSHEDSFGATKDELDGGNDDATTPQSDKATSQGLSGNTQDSSLPMFIREEEFSWIDPSPAYNSTDEACTLPLIKEDQGRVNDSVLSTSFVEGASSDLSSSNEQLEGTSRKLRWV